MSFLRSSSPADPAPPNACEAPGADVEPNTEDLLKVRKLLIGGDLAAQRESVEALGESLRTQLERLETQSAEQVSEAQASAGRRVAAVERAFASKLEEHGARLRNEGDLRVEAEQRLSADIASLRADFDEGMIELRQELETARTEARDRLLAQGKLLTESIRRHQAEVLEKLSACESDLDHRKVDRKRGGSPADGARRTTRRR